MGSSAAGGAVSSSIPGQCRFTVTGEALQMINVFGTATVPPQLKYAAPLEIYPMGVYFEGIETPCEAAFR